VDLDIRYRLRHPATGFIQSNKQIMTIPAGAIVTAKAPLTLSPALCSTVSEDEVIEAYRMDIEDNGEVLWAPVGEMTPMLLSPIGTRPGTVMALARLSYTGKSASSQCRQRTVA